MHLGWDYLKHKIPTDTTHGTSVKIYLINSVFDPNTQQGTYWQHNPASTYGQFVDSVVAWYPYSGDREAINLVRTMLDYQLAHGTTPADWDWSNDAVCWFAGTNPSTGAVYRVCPMISLEELRSTRSENWESDTCSFTNSPEKRIPGCPGIRCAERVGQAYSARRCRSHSLAVCVYAKTGDVLNGEIYGGMIVAPVRLFAELASLKQGQVAEYTRAQKMAWDWILKYPMRNNRWVGYFEDIRPTTDMANQASPTMTAYYILASEAPVKLDESWAEHVGNLMDWVKRRFGRGPYFGAWGIDEQGPPPDFHYCCSRAGLSSDTSRWGAINAMYYEKTGDAQAREDAFRSLSYATYFSDSEGKVSCCGLYFENAYWFDDGYGDYIRNFLWAMGAIPEFAPRGQDHLLRSTSVVTNVQYGLKCLSYKTFWRGRQRGFAPQLCAETNPRGKRRNTSDE